MKICPFCKLEILAEAVKCRYCAAMLGTPLRSEVPSRRRLLVDVGIFAVGAALGSLVTLLVA